MMGRIAKHCDISTDGMNVGQRKPEVSVIFSQLKNVDLMWSTNTTIVEIISDKMEYGSKYSQHREAYRGIEA